MAKKVVKSMASELKVLYKKDPKLAKEVAKVLGFKIKIKAEDQKKPNAAKIKKDITDMLKKEMNTMSLGKDIEKWLEQLPEFAGDKK